MKIWIQAASTARAYVAVNANSSDFYGNEIWLCRIDMTRLLRGSGKRLPRHGSKKIVEIELTAK
jgi:hypothetical protein